MVISIIGMGDWDLVSSGMVWYGTRDKGLMKMEIENGNMEIWYWKKVEAD